MDQFHTELLPIEVESASLQALFRSQLKKGITLDQIIETVQKSTPITGKRAIEEAKKWLELLVTVRKEMGELHPKEAESVHRMTEELNKEGDLEPRMAAYHDLEGVLNRAIDEMEEKTRERTQKIVLNYEKLGKEKHAKIQATFDQFFKQFKESADQIVRYLRPRLEEFHRRVVSSGRGFLLESEELPCSILFSHRGHFWLLFKKLGHLLGSGVDKLVFRAICLPEGKIHAVIQPFFIPEMTAKGQTEAAVKEKQFHDMWTETQMLLKLKGKTGIVELIERMAFSIHGEKKLYLVEDYYWDGTLKDYLKYPIHLQLIEARLSTKDQKKVITDLLAGLVEIHKHNIVHHDIKADNILIDQDSVKVAIADFHLATYAQDRIRIGELKFLPKWAPPEHAKNHLSDLTMEEKIKKEIALTTGKMDVWSLGLIFYCLIAYQLPFWFDQGGTIEEVFPILARLEKGWLPEELKSSPYYPLLEKMLEPDPNGRCTAAEALAMI